MSIVATVAVEFGHLDSGPAKAPTVNLSKVRSILCVPGHELDRRLPKAHTSGADLLLLDLEDSVPVMLKVNAGLRVRELVRPGDIVRINHPSTAEFEIDVLALNGLSSLVVMVPKVESADDLCHVYGAFDRKGCAIQIVAAIETPRGLLALPPILSGWSTLVGLAFGRWDFMASCGITDPWSPLIDHAMAQISVAAKAYGLHVSDAPCYSLDDGDLMTREVNRARRFGFDSKGCVHPSQVPYCRALGPSDEDRRKAQQIIDAGDSGAVRCGSTLVGPPMRKLATTVLGERQ